MIRCLVFELAKEMETVMVGSKVLHSVRLWVVLKVLMKGQLLVKKLVEVWVPSMEEDWISAVALAVHQIAI